MNSEVGCSGLWIFVSFKRESALGSSCTRIGVSTDVAVLRLRKKIGGEARGQLMQLTGVMLTNLCEKKAPLFQFASHFIPLVVLTSEVKNKGHSMDIYEVLYRLCQAIKCVFGRCNINGLVMTGPRKIHVVCLPQKMTTMSLSCFFSGSSMYLSTRNPQKINTKSKMWKAASSSISPSSLQFFSLRNSRCDPLHRTNIYLFVLYSNNHAGSKQKQANKRENVVTHRLTLSS